MTPPPLRPFERAIAYAFCAGACMGLLLAVLVASLLDAAR